MQRTKTAELERQRRHRMWMRRVADRENFGKSFCEATLKAARAADRIFSATFFSRRYISLVDQQYRSLRLCHALCEEQELITSDAKVAIVGAGISGMTCAAALVARTDCIVHVFEADNLLLRRLREAPFRFIHPDLNHWTATSRVYRWEPDRRTIFPLMNWSGGYAPLVAEELLRKFAHLRYCTGIALHIGESVAAVLEREGKPVIVLASAKNLEFATIPFDVAIIATGFGEERQAVDTETRMPITTDCSYWRSGNPESYRLSGRRDPDRPKRVLVAGNGDSGVMELAHHLVRDFTHDRIYEFFPRTNIKVELWEHFHYVATHLRYQRIEVGYEERYLLAGPISWYWHRRERPRSWRTPEEKESRASPLVAQIERKIFETIHKALADIAPGKVNDSDLIRFVEESVDKDIDALASHEIRAGMNAVFNAKNYDVDFVASKFVRGVELKLVGPTPTMYSRRQSPLIWYMLRMLSEFADIGYEQSKLISVKVAKNGYAATLSGIRTKPRFDVISIRQGPDYGQGLRPELKRFESCVSGYAVAGNPIPGDEVRFPGGGPTIIDNPNRSLDSYLYFLARYFRTKFWKSILRRGVPIQDLSEMDGEAMEIDPLKHADLMMLLIHRDGNQRDRARGEKLFRTFKSADRRSTRTRALRALNKLNDDIKSQIWKVYQELLQQHNHNTYASAQLLSQARNLVRGELTLDLQYAR